MFNKDKLGTYIFIFLILISLTYKSYDLYFSPEAKARICVSHFLRDVQKGGIGKQYLAPIYRIDIAKKINSYSFMITQKCTQPNTYMVCYRIKTDEDGKKVSKTAKFEVVNDKITEIAESY